MKTNFFGWKMMVKSCLEFFILKFYKPLQRYLLTWQTNSAFRGSFFSLGSSNSEGASRISKWKILDHFSPSFVSQKCWFQDLRFYLTYSMSSRWCELWKFLSSSHGNSLWKFLCWAGTWYNFYCPDSSEYKMKINLSQKILHHVTSDQAGPGGR